MDEIKNLSIQELDTPQYAAEFDRRVHEILTSNSRNYEVHHFSRDGRLLEFESRVSRVSYQGKTAILTILRNINERNRNQRFLEQSLRGKRASSAGGSSSGQEQPADRNQPFTPAGGQNPGSCKSVDP